MAGKKAQAFRFNNSIASKINEEPLNSFHPHAKTKKGRFEFQNVPSNK
jgi:hypothetical protein